MKTRMIVIVLSIIASRVLADEVLDFTMAQSGGIEQESPNTSSPDLNYRLNSGTCPNSQKNALFKMNVVGSGPSQVPPGSTINQATLWLTSEAGGDGLLYRCAEPWDASPTWNELGGSVSTIGAAIGVGLSTNQTKGFTVTSHVQLWADGSSNQGWVIKGAVNDCSDAQISDDSFLRVVLVPLTPRLRA